MRYHQQPLQQRCQTQSQCHLRPVCHPRRHGRHRQGGFLLLDIVLGCSLLAIIFVAMLGSAHMYSNGQKKMDSRRAATRLAESVMTDLQRGETTLPAEGVRITRMEERIALGTVDNGLVWCEVHATANDIEVSLAGLVPLASLNAIHAAPASQSTPAQVNTPGRLQEVTP